MPLPKRELPVRSHQPASKKLRKSLPASKGENAAIRVDLNPTQNVNWPLEQIRRDLGPQKKTPMPTDLKPMLASLIDAPFDGKEWQFEIKWDGYRTLAYVAKGDTQLRSRNNLSFNAKYPTIVAALNKLPLSAVFDGEIVVLSESGKADFEALQNWHLKEQGQLLFYVFDLLWLEGTDLQNEPLEVRREVLRKIVPDNGPVRFSDSIEECGKDFFTTAKQNGLEGIIAKRKGAPYKPGTRTETWYKIKAETRHEALICGYTKKKDSPRLISSLLLGIPRDGALQYIGQVGTGFTARMQQYLFKKMNPLFTSECPFAQTPNTCAPTLWLKPQLVCEVKYTELTRDGLMRHPSFQGLREDKGAADLNVEGTLKADGKNDSPQQVQSRTNKKRLLDEREDSKVIILDGQEQQLTNLTKPYWIKEKISKGDLLNYYHQMAPFILPYIQDRPQSLNRFPNGITGKSFYQKDMKGKVAPWLKTFERISDSSGEVKEFLVCTGAASLLYMANLGSIEMNPWHSRISSPHYPDWCVIDLDPGAISFEKVIQTARVVHSLLESLAIPSYPKTSGSTGIHIYIPLGAQYNYEQSRQLAELIATLVHNELPAITSLVRNPEKRKDKIYIDYLQNRPIQTICAPYSIRPKPKATVSAPLHWEEVKKGLKMHQFTINSMWDRVTREGDLFKGVLGKGINLNSVLQSLTALV
jgi:bifunctional non-homologous end joining protein LigD